MTDTAPGTVPLPTRRQLRRIEEAARAAGEGPLSPEELLRRARAEASGALPGEGTSTPEDRGAAPLSDGSAATPPAAGEGGPAAENSGSAAGEAQAHPQRPVFPPTVDPAVGTAVPAPPAWAPEDSVGAVTAALDIVGIESLMVEPVEQPEPLTAPEASDTARETDAGAPAETGPAALTGAPADAQPSAETDSEQPAAAEEKDYGKAGRNLPAAIGVGALLGGAVLASLVFYPASFIAIVLLGVCAAMWELSNALKQSGARVSTLPTITAAGCMVLATAFGGLEALWVAFSAGAGAVLLFTLLEDRLRPGNAVKDVCLSLFALTYVGLMASFVVHMLSFESGNLLVITFLALVVASDIGGYIAGTTLGRHPIAPSISPKKSWEGFAGSALMSTAVGMGMAHWAFDAPLWTGVVLGVVMPAFATLGDFAESMIKRDLGLKDMGTLLPGHGGVMDRLDSILPTAPVALILFTFLPGFIVLA